MPVPRFVEQPVEKAPWEQGFAAVFEAEILPGLQTQEVRRLRAVALLWKLLTITLLLAVGVGLLLWLDSTMHWAWRWIALPLGTLLAGWLAYRIARASYRDELREVVMPPLCRFLGGLTYHRQGQAGAIPIKPLMDSGLIPPATRYKLEDYLAGRWRALDYEMVELRVIRESLTPGGKVRGRTAVYRGLILRMAVPLAFEGSVVITRDFGTLGNELALLAGVRPAMNKIEVPHAGFEQQFEVRGDGRAPLEQLLTPQFLAALLLLDQTRGGKGLTAAFLDGACYLALPLHDDLFEFGSPFRSVYRMAEHLHTLLFEATLPRRVIDALHGEPPRQVI